MTQLWMLKGMLDDGTVTHEEVLSLYAAISNKDGVVDINTISPRGLNITKHIFKRAGLDVNETDPDLLPGVASAVDGELGKLAEAKRLSEEYSIPLGGKPGPSEIMDDHSIDEPNVKTGPALGPNL